MRKLNPKQEALHVPRVTPDVSHQKNQEQNPHLLPHGSPDIASVVPYVGQYGPGPASSLEGWLITPSQGKHPAQYPKTPPAGEQLWPEPSIAHQMGRLALHGREMDESSNLTFSRNPSCLCQQKPHLHGAGTVA